MPRFLVEIDIVAPDSDSFDIFKMLEEMFADAKQKGKPFITYHGAVVNTADGEKFNQDDWHDIQEEKETRQSLRYD